MMLQITMVEAVGAVTLGTLQPRLLFFLEAAEHGGLASLVHESGGAWSQSSREVSGPDASMIVSLVRSTGIMTPGFEVEGANCSSNTRCQLSMDVKTPDGQCHQRIDCLESGICGPDAQSLRIFVKKLLETVDRKVQSMILRSN